MLRAPISIFLLVLLAAAGPAVSADEYDYGRESEASSGEEGGGLLGGLSSGLSSVFGGSEEETGTTASASDQEQQPASASQSQSQAQSPRAGAYTGLKKIVAVSRFENKSAAYSGGKQFLGEGLADQLTDALIQSGAFIVLERQVLSDVIGEQDLAASGRVAKSQSARTGKLTAAQFLVQGTITEFSAGNESNDSSINVAGFSFGGGSGETHIGLIIRLIDSTTGEVVASQRVEGKAESSNSSTGLSLGGLGFSSGSQKSDPLGKASQIAIDNAVEFVAQRLRNEPFRGRVIQAEGETVIISAGGRNGARAGDTFTVLSVGKELRDPLTGELLGRVEHESGSLRITKVQEKYSFARKLGQFKLKVGDFIQHSAL